MERRDGADDRARMECRWGLTCEGDCSGLCSERMSPEEREARLERAALESAREHGPMLGLGLGMVTTSHSGGPEEMDGEPGPDANEPESLYSLEPSLGMMDLERSGLESIDSGSPVRLRLSGEMLSLPMDAAGEVHPLEYHPGGESLGDAISERPEVRARRLSLESIHAAARYSREALPALSRELVDLGEYASPRAALLHLLEEPVEAAYRETFPEYSALEARSMEAARLRLGLYRLGEAEAEADALRYSGWDSPASGETLEQRARRWADAVRLHLGSGIPLEYLSIYREPLEPMLLSGSESVLEACIRAGEAALWYVSSSGTFWTSMEEAEDGAVREMVRESVEGWALCSEEQRAEARARWIEPGDGPSEYEWRLQIEPLHPLPAPPVSISEAEVEAAGEAVSAALEEAEREASRLRCWKCGADLSEEYSIRYLEAYSARMDSERPGVLLYSSSSVDSSAECDSCGAEVRQYEEPEAVS